MSTHTHTRQGAVGRLMVLLIVKVLGYPENIRKEFCLTSPRPLLKAQSSHSNWSSHWKQMPYRQGSAALARRWKWDSPVAPPRDRAPSKIPRSSLPWTCSDIWLPNQHEALVSCGLFKPLGLLPLGKPLAGAKERNVHHPSPPPGGISHGASQGAKDLTSMPLRREISHLQIPAQGYTSPSRKLVLP